MATGSIVVNVTTSNHLIPISDASVSVSVNTNEGRRALGFRHTNQNGATEPIIIETPEAALSRAPGDETPFAYCDVTVSHPNYERSTVFNVQIFSDIESIQNSALVPLPENADTSQSNANYYITPQNL